MRTPGGSFPNPGPHFSICRMGPICRLHGGPGRACPVLGPKVGRDGALDSILDSAPFHRPPQLASRTCPCVQSTNCTTDQKKKFQKTKKKKTAFWWSRCGDPRGRTCGRCRAPSPGTPGAGQPGAAESPKPGDPRGRAAEPAGARRRRCPVSRPGVSPARAPRVSAPRQAADKVRRISPRSWAPTPARPGAPITPARG